MLAVLERIATRPTYLNRIAVRGAEGTRFVDTRDVDWLKAAENYVELHVGKDCHLIEATMAEIAERLDRGRFVRIHRSFIVAVDKVSSIDHTKVILENDASVPLGGLYKEEFLEKINMV